MAEFDPNFTETYPNDAQTYESLFSVPNAVSPSAAVLNRTSNYAAPSPTPPVLQRPAPLGWGDTLGLALQAGAAGLAGRANPTEGILKAREDKATLENQRRQQEFENQLRIGREIREARNEADRDIKSFMDLLKSSDSPGLATLVAKGYARTKPALLEMLGGEEGLNNLTVDPKGRKVTVDRMFSDGELVDPINNKPYPAGPYKVTGNTRGGSFQIDTIEPSPSATKEEAAAATERRFQQREERVAIESEKRHAENQQNMARMMSQFAQAQAGTDRRHAETLAAVQAERLRIEPTQRRELSNLHEAIQITDTYRDAHQELLDVTKGKFSTQFKQALAANSRAKTFGELTSVIGNTAPEQKFAAEYNIVIGNLRKLTDERQLSENDVPRNLKSYDPTVTPAQLQANLASRTRSYIRDLTQTLSQLKTQGKNIAGFEFKPQARYDAIKARKPNMTEAQIYNQMQKEGY